MSVSKIKYCDCCGTAIPYEPDRIHMEYDGHVAACKTYVAEDAGNHDFNPNALVGDKIYGIVDLYMHRNSEVTTVVPVNDGSDGTRCMDICPTCKIRFLKKAIEMLKLQYPTAKD